MSIKVCCPSCNAGFNVAEKHAGKKTKCPKCGGQIEIPTFPAKSDTNPLPEVSPEKEELAKRQEAARKAAAQKKQAEHDTKEKQITLSDSTSAQREDRELAAKLANLIACPDCNAMVSPRATACPKCGGPLSQQEPFRTAGESFSHHSRGRNILKGRGCLVAIALIVFLAMIRYLVEPEDDAAPQVKSQQSFNSGDRPTIPNDVEYTFRTTQIIPTIKRSLDVNLNKRVTKATLEAIAHKLKNADAGRYDRTFIGYFLPGMETNKYWAITYFTPELEVCIHGLTVEQYQKLTEQPATDSTLDIIGTWLHEGLGGFGSGGVRITLFRQNDRVLMEEQYGDGSVGKTEMTESSSSQGMRFDYKPDRGNGEYWIINQSGDLQNCDADGPFTTARKLN